MVSIRTKTLTLLFLSIASCSLILSIIMINITYQNLQAQVKEKLSLLTDTTQKEIALDNMPVENAVNDMGNVVVATFNPELAEQNPKAYLPRYLDSIGQQVKEITQNTKGAVGGYVYPNIELYKGIYDVWYIIENGKFVKTDKQETAEMFYPTNDSMTWYYSPIINKKALWTHVYFDEVLKENCISFVKPIIMNNVVIGMAGIDASFTVKKDTVEAIKIYTTGSAFLLDDKRQFVVPPKANVTVSKEDLDKIYKGIEKADKGEIDVDGYYMSFAKMANDQILVIAAPKKEVLEPIQRIIVWIVLLTICIATTVMIIGSIVSKNIIDPLDKLKDFANKLGNGNMEESVTVKSNDEVGDLAESFEKLRISILQQNTTLAKYGQDLEEKVKERTKQLEDKNVELERINKVTMDREIKMIELKKKIEELEAKQNGN
jgi:methyl-accepting chemotaxis protein